jgi:signal peptidase I
MFSFFAPRYVKQGRAFLKDARKLLAYKRDLWSDAAVTEFETGIRRLETALAERNKGRAEEAATALDQQAGTLIKPQADSGWRENCEVFLVAIVIALGVRTYILQPFTIPTGSMQPTLNGIIGYPTAEPPPNFLCPARPQSGPRADVDRCGGEDRRYHRRRARDEVDALFHATTLIGQRSSYTVNCPRDTLQRYFIGALRPYRAGEVIARGYYDTGDHVFVDKMTYHFRHPRRDEVFVFNSKTWRRRRTAARAFRAVAVLHQAAGGIAGRSLANPATGAADQWRAGERHRFQQRHVGEEWLPRLFQRIRAALHGRLHRASAAHADEHPQLTGRDIPGAAEILLRARGQQLSQL